MDLDVDNCRCNKIDHALTQNHNKGRKSQFQTFPRVPLKRNGQLPNKRGTIIHKITNPLNDRHFSKEKNFLNYS